eukprot:354452_1
MSLPKCTNIVRVMYALVIGISVSLMIIFDNPLGAFVAASVLWLPLLTCAIYGCINKYMEYKSFIRKPIDRKLSQTLINIMYHFLHLSAMMIIQWILFYILVSYFVGMGQYPPDAPFLFNIVFYDIFFPIISSMQYEKLPTTLNDQLIHIIFVSKFFFTLSLLVIIIYSISA